MIIYGAGMAGLLAANMLRRYNPIVREAAPSLPKNHAALLRFRSDAVSRATGIPFKKVYVQKAVLSHDGRLNDKPTLQEQNMYAYKVMNAVTPRSIMNLEPGYRYIAPPDFVEQLAANVNIEYDVKLDKEKINKKSPMISTIPMPELMQIVDWPEIPDFKFHSVMTITADITSPEIDIYQTIYDPSIVSFPYRMSITGNKLILEIAETPHKKFPVMLVYTLCRKALACFFDYNINANNMLKIENVEVKTQKYGKLLLMEKNRKEFILAMTDLYNIYSLGRFSTWRQIVLDDVVKDIEFIANIHEQRDSYARRIAAIS